MNDLLIIVCLCGAGFVHGFTGFGYAMTAMALLPLLMALPQVLFLGAFFTLPVAGALFRKHGGQFRWKDARWLLAGAVVGTPPGLLLVQSLDRVLLLRALGVVLIVFSLSEMFGLQRAVRMPDGFAFPVGIVCGILGGAFNVSGPVAIVYIFSRGWTRAQATATLQMLFLFNSGLRVVLTLPTGVVTVELAALCALAIVPFMVAVLLGHRLTDRVHPPVFKRFVQLGIVSMGIRYVLMAG